MKNTSAKETLTYISHCDIRTFITDSTEVTMKISNFLANSLALIVLLAVTSISASKNILSIADKRSNLSGQYLELSHKSNFDRFEIKLSWPQNLSIPECLQLLKEAQHDQHDI